MGIVVNLDSSGVLPRVSETEEIVREIDARTQQVKSAITSFTVHPNPVNFTPIAPTYAPTMQKVQKVTQKPLIQGSAAYIEMIRRAAPKELADLEAELGKLSEKEKNIQLFQEALQSGNWKNPIFKNKKIPYYALEALKRDLIRKEDFATSQILWEIQQAHHKEKIHTIRLFKDNGQVTFLARHLLEQTLVMNKPPENEMEKIYAPYYLENKEQLEEFFKAMKELPKPQQVLWVVPDIYTGKKDGLALLKKQGFNLFGQVNGDRIIPSLGLMQTFLNVKFKDNAVQINPVLGLSSMRDIVENGKTHMRDIAFHHPAIALPDIADEASAKWYSFFYHDFLHAVVCSAASKILRPILAVLAGALHHFLENIQMTSKEEKKIKNLMEVWADQFDVKLEKGVALSVYFWRKFYKDLFAEGFDKLTPKTQEKILHLLISQLVQMPALQEGPRIAFSTDEPTHHQRLLCDIWDQLKSPKL